MNERLSEMEELMVGKWIEENNCSELEKWIGDDPDKAREVYSQYLSLKALGEMHSVIYPSPQERRELVGRRFTKKAKEVKKVVVSFIEQRLKPLVGGDYQILPQPGFARSKKDSTILDFGDFKVGYIEGEETSFDLKFSKCHQISVEKLMDINIKKIYDGKKVSQLTLPLQAGKYRISVDQEIWELELK